jgi:hypothetical protein
LVPLPPPQPERPEHAPDPETVAKIKLDAVEQTCRFLLNRIKAASLHEVGARVETLLFVLEREHLFPNECRHASVVNLSEYLDAVPASVCRRASD